ncbi:unnamed protein product [Phyllotreta striolata]|uniref:Uncharacterized protein n=1 Tax=Phyllotreta striolata TaxID=444603 RepID=A0A9N9TUF4_PHYSR|nr:unnamed protein product [Phyllotreta striolata]
MGGYGDLAELEEDLRRRCFEDCDDRRGYRDGTCPTIFEDYLCWPATEAGRVVIRNCTSDVITSDIKGTLERKCSENGTWLPLDYSVVAQCGNMSVIYSPNSTNMSEYELHLYNTWIPIMKDISYCGYTLSIISSILSICILLNIQRLRCSRNKLHTNLFASFVLRSLMSVLKDCMFVDGTFFFFEPVLVKYPQPYFPPDLNYPWCCKAFMSLRYYVIMSNFMLMLMEGMYLHNLMFLKLFSDHHSVTIYCVLGWGLPLIFICPWVILRVLYENLLCWTESENSYIRLIIDGPIGLTVVINFILFLTIVRVLKAKLNNACIQQRKIKYGKLLKATTILIPLFGVPYGFSLLLSIYTNESVVLELIYLFFDQSFAAFQGLFAAFVYCLSNNEVHVEIRRKYVLMKERNNREFGRRSRTISNTQQTSLQLYDDTMVETICMNNKHPQIVVQGEQQCHF